MLSDRCPVCLVCPVMSVCDVDVLWPNGWMDEGETWQGGRPMGTQLPQRGTALQFFGRCLLWPNGWMDQDATWYTEVNLGPGHIMLDGDPATPAKEAQHPLFSALVYCGQTEVHLSYY